MVERVGINNMMSDEDLKKHNAKVIASMPYFMHEKPKEQKPYKFRYKEL